MIIITCNNAGRSQHPENKRIMQSSPNAPMKTNPVFFSVILLISTCSLARADLIDDRLAMVRQGAPATLSESERADVIKPDLERVIEKWKTAEVNLYVEKVKASLIDEIHDGGWPFRCSVVESNSENRPLIYQELRRLHGESNDAIIAYSLICPALYMKDTELAAQIRSELKSKDAFLSARVEKNYDMWKRHIDSILAKETAATK
jgi:hypothetical protein